MTEQPVFINTSMTAIPYLCLQHAPLALRLCQLLLQCCMLRRQRLMLLLLLARLRHAPLHAAAQRVKLTLQVTARGVLRAEGVRLHTCKANILGSCVS
jgi:hypothetical protein